MAIFSCALRTCKLHVLVGVLLMFNSAAGFAVNIMIAPGGPSGLSGETMYGPPFAAPIPVGAGPTPLLLPPPPGNPPAAPGAYIVNAISSSVDAGHFYHFSVDAAAVGAPASAVLAETTVGTAPSQVPPGPAGGALPPEAMGDIFTIIPGPIFGIPGLTVPVIASPADEFVLGLNVGDDVNGIMNRTPIGGVGTAYYSLGFGGLGLGPFLPGDIVDGSLVPVGPPPGLWAGAPALGLDVLGGPGTDDIDALIVHDVGVFGVYEPGIDFVAFSLDPASFTLGAPACGLSAADLLVPIPFMGCPVSVFIPAAGFGLLAGDNLNAIDVTYAPVPAAVWLFGSALGILGWMRRKKAH